MSMRSLLIHAAIVAMTMRFACFAAVLPDAREVMRRSLEAGERNAELARRYVYSQRSEDRELDSNGKAKPGQSKTYEVVMIEGRPARKLVARDDKPLTSDDVKKQREHLDKIAAERRGESPRDKEKRMASAEEARTREKAFNREVLTAFNFRIVGEERLNGRDVWIVEGTPRPGYRPKEMKAQILPHVKGKVWIDKEDYGWAKVDAEVLDDFSFGVVLARMDKGSRFYFEQSRETDEVWLPKKNIIQAAARVALIKKVRIDEVTTFRDYRKVD